MKQGTQDTNDQNNHQVPWNKGKLIGQKSPLKLKEIWAMSGVNYPVRVTTITLAGFS